MGRCASAKHDGGDAWRRRLALGMNAQEAREEVSLQKQLLHEGPDGVAAEGFDPLDGPAGMMERVEGAGEEGGDGGQDQTATPTTQEERQNPATQQPMAFQPSKERAMETMNHPRAMK